jgi:hypothetical protein
MARSRASDSAGTDWKALAAHLEVPLPYLLYRAQTRFEEDLRGLRDIRGALSPASTAKPTEEYFSNPSPISRVASRLASSSSRTSRLSTPLGVRARLASLGGNISRPPAAASTSTLTAVASRPAAQNTAAGSSFSSDEDSDSGDSDDEAERDQEEQESLDRKLRELQSMMTNDALGLVSSNRARTVGKSIQRGRDRPTPSRYESDSSRNDDLSSSRSASQSLSEASSPQGSIPSIPSPPSEPARGLHRHLNPSKSSSPPALSPRSAQGQSHLRSAPRLDFDSSNQGSEASSFSDLSDASLSASALESALMSNVRPHNSRFSSAFSRSRFGRGGHQ